MNQYNDKELMCLCGETFVWSIGEQEFLNDLKNNGKIAEVVPPKRCFSCRQKKKQQQNQSSKQNYF